MRASTARLMNSPVRLADLTFPQVNRLIHRTRLAFIHIDNLLAFNQKSLSQYGSYLNCSLQQAVGIQFRLDDRWDLRTGFEVFHFSDAFMVPSNPGLDSMAYNAALTLHLGKRTAGL